MKTVTKTKDIWDDLGDILLVGEGNLSFSKSLINSRRSITSLVSTTYEAEKHLTNQTSKNAFQLRCLGAKVYHGVDATKLDKTINPRSNFDKIIFQFPNVGSRDPKYGHNPNHIMIRKFLKSALPFLKPNGEVYITSVNSPYYRGVFQFEQAAVYAGYRILDICPFNPKMFYNYSHINTNDESSAIKHYKQFSTWIFGA